MSHDRDEITGRSTTGHEWDGLRELNTPLPKWWLYVLYATILFAAGQFLLYPSLPYFSGYFHGLLGYSQRTRVAQDIHDKSAERRALLDRIAAAPFDRIRADSSLLTAATTAGRLAFAENCQPCHGAGGAGRIGYPALAAGAWIWGGRLEDIQTTITHGIRYEAESRDSAMPRFGADGVLKPAQIDAVADYVYATFYNHPTTADLSSGAKIFAENCAACHGDHGQGGREFGAPRLASQVHLYGGTRETIVGQVTNPHLGVMPAWSKRLSPGLIKSLALYVHGLGGGE